MKNFIEFELITELRSVLSSMNPYLTSDFTSCAESAIYILQIFANNFATKRDTVLQ